MKLNILVFLGFLTIVSSCKEAEFMEYQDEDRIQFGPNNPDLIYRSDYETQWKFQDTTKGYSFYFEKEEVTVDTLFFDLYTLGRVVDYDRPYKLVQTEEEGVKNAKAGIHYQAFDAPESKELYVVEAGKAHVRVPIVLFRDESLKDDPYILSFKIQENEHFKLGAATNTWRKATVADKLIQPPAWDAIGTQYYWGAYSTVKHQFMIDASGLEWDQEVMASLAYDETTYFRAVFKKALTDYNSSHSEPLRDENNQLVVFP